MTRLVIRSISWRRILNTIRISDFGINILEIPLETFAIQIGTQSLLLSDIAEVSVVELRDPMVKP